jgi:hypothetical protein
MKWIKKYIKHLNNFLKLVALRKQLPKEKKEKYQSQTSCLENNVNSPWSKIKFRGTKKVP